MKIAAVPLLACLLLQPAAYAQGKAEDSSKNTQKTGVSVSTTTVKAPSTPRASPMRVPDRIPKFVPPEIPSPDLRLPQKTLKALEETRKQEEAILKKAEDLRKKIQAKQAPGAQPKLKPLPSNFTEDYVRKLCKVMETGDYEHRKAAFYEIYQMRLGFVEGWRPFPADSTAKAAIIRLLSRELDYQTPVPDLPGRPCRGENCSRYLMDLLSATASIRNSLAVPALLKSYNGMAGFGGFVYLSVTQYGDSVFRPLEYFYRQGTGDVRDRALYSLILLYTGGGWYGDVRASSDTAKKIKDIAIAEMGAKTTDKNLRRKAMVVRLLRSSSADPLLGLAAEHIYKNEPEVKKACDDAYLSGLLDRELLRYLRVEPPSAHNKPAASRETKTPPPQKNKTDTGAGTSK